MATGAKVEMETGAEPEANHSPRDEEVDRDRNLYSQRGADGQEGGRCWSLGAQVAAQQGHPEEAG